MAKRRKKKSKANKLLPLIGLAGAVAYFSGVKSGFKLSGQK